MNKKRIFLTAKQVSICLSIPVRTVQYLSKQGKIRSYKIGKQWRYLRGDIEKYGIEFNKEKKQKFLTTKQISEYLCIPIRTIRRLSKQGKIKAIKIGKHWRYNKIDIEKCANLGINVSREPTQESKCFNERRSYPRINCSIPCSISVSIQDEREFFSIGRVSNLSQGGVLIKKHNGDNLFDNIKADDPIDVEFGLNKDDKLKVEARVLRKQGNGFAVKFRNLPDKHRNKIIQYVG